MSRLIDILQRIDQATIQPMGFGANRQAPVSGVDLRFSHLTHSIDSPSDEALQSDDV